MCRQRPRQSSAGKQLRRGATLVLIAMLLPILLILVGFSVDLAHMQRSRAELRAVADLAAKAAAGELSRTQNPAQAKSSAILVAAANKVAGKPVALSDEDIVFGHSQRQLDGTWSFVANANPLNSVQVTARRDASCSDGPIDLFFGRLYGKPYFEPHHAATSSFLDVDICLVLDRSSSMKLTTADTSGFMAGTDSRFCLAPQPDSRWVALANAVALFVDRLEATDANEQLGVVTFASNYTSTCGETSAVTTLDQPLSTNLALTDTAMTNRSNTVWNGNTDIAAGIARGKTELTGPRSRPYATKVMVVLTDGVYTGADPVPNASTAGSNGIIVHTITFSNGANQADMQSVAAAGYGYHYHAPDEAALADVFQQIAGSLAILTQ